MWDTATEQMTLLGAHLSHDLPCQRCGHALHTFLPCGDGCTCTVVGLPGQLVAVSGRRVEELLA